MIVLYFAVNLVLAVIYTVILFSIAPYLCNAIEKVQAWLNELGGKRNGDGRYP